MTKHGNYRKMNDRTKNSSTYHKKDGTPIRARLKEETRELTNDALTGNPFSEEPALAPFEAYDTSAPEPCPMCLESGCSGWH